MSTIDFIQNSKKIVAISNFKFSKDIEDFCSQYDCIIRFNSGSNPLILQKQSFYNGRVDVCALSGWSGGYFGSLDGFKDKKILCTRPNYLDEKYDNWYKNISIKQEFIDDIQKYTTKINYISYKIFVDFNNMYDYIHPSSGLITLFYIKKYLNTNIDCVNFFVDKTMYNYFINVPTKVHQVDKEKEIMQTLNINNIII